MRLVIHWLVRAAIGLAFILITASWRCAGSGDDCYESLFPLFLTAGYFVLLPVDALISWLFNRKLNAPKLQMFYQWLLPLLAVGTLGFLLYMLSMNQASRISYCKLRAQEYVGACHNPSEIDLAVLNDTYSLTRIRKENGDSSLIQKFEQAIRDEITEARNRCIYDTAGKVAAFDFEKWDEFDLGAKHRCTSNAPIDPLWTLWFGQSLEDAFRPAGEYPRTLREREELQKRYWNKQL